MSFHFLPQAIQDMNSLKRFVRQAEMSHYALFRCCQFLQGCGNGDVLLQNVRAEHSDLPEACSIISVLEEFLKEQSQAQAWFHWEHLPPCCDAVVEREKLHQLQSRTQIVKNQPLHPTLNIVRYNKS